MRQSFGRFDARAAASLIWRGRSPHRANQTSAAIPGDVERELACSAIAFKDLGTLRVAIELLPRLIGDPAQRLPDLGKRWRNAGLFEAATNLHDIHRVFPRTAGGRLGDRVSIHSAGATSGASWISVRVFSTAS